MQELWLKHFKLWEEVTQMYIRPSHLSLEPQAVYNSRLKPLKADALAMVRTKLMNAYEAAVVVVGPVALALNRFIFFRYVNINYVMS
jgi:hypothetical protein